MPPTDPPKPASSATERLSVEVLDPALCPRFVGRWVSGVQVGPSPDWVQMRLLAAGQRPISNVVDASNYVMLEFGKPIHTFDAAAVHDGRIVVRRASPASASRPSTTSCASSTRRRSLIADATGPLGIAGIMGGAASEIGEGTTDVVVESAIFEPTSIRRSAFRYALRSEASLRFEKGQEFRLARIGADRTALLIAEWAGGKVAPGAVDYEPERAAAAHVAFRPARVNRLLGTDFATEEQRALLARVGIETAPAAAGTRSASLRATSPWTSTPAMPRWSMRPSRAGGATSRSRPTSQKRSSASVATSSSRPPCRTRRCRLPPRSARGARRRPRDARRRRSHRGRDVRPCCAAAWSSVPWPTTTATGARGSGAAGRPWSSRIRCRASTRSFARAWSGACSRSSRPTCATAATTSRSSRSERATAPPGDPPTHEWWRLGFALTGAAEPPAWNRPARAVRPRRRQGRRRAALPPARPRSAGLRRRSPTTRTSIPAGPPGSDGRRRPRRPARRASSRTSRRLDLRAERVFVAELAIAGLAGGEPRRASRDDAVAPSPRSSATWPSSSPAAIAGGRRSRPPSARMAGRCCATSRCSTSTAASRWPTTDKSLAYRLTLRGDERTLTEAEVDAAVAGVMAGLADDVGAAPHLTATLDCTAPQQTVPGDVVLAGALRRSEGRCYPCAAPALPVSDHPRRRTLDLGEFTAGSRPSTC